MSSKAAFGAALKQIREVRNLSQEDFSFVSSRTSISSLERGLKGLTLDKIVLDVHPLTLISARYLASDSNLTDDQLN